MILDKSENLNFKKTALPGDELISYKLPHKFEQDFEYIKIGHKFRHKHQGIFKSQNLYIYSISDSKVVGKDGNIYKGRNYIKESVQLWTDSKHEISSILPIRMPMPLMLKGICFNATTLSADGGFYHFFLELLPKFYLIQDISDQFDHIFINGPATIWKTRWLTHIGIDLNKIKWVDYKTHFICEQIFFTSRVMNDQQPTRFIINSIKALVKHQNVKGEEKKIIWITRRKEPTRNIIWEEDVVSLFPQIKFVELKDYLPADTINLFENASHVISPHGAGLSNIIFCQPQTKILEIFPNSHSYHPMYSRISHLADLQHHIIHINFTDKNVNYGLQFLKKTLTSFINDQN